MALGKDHFPGFSRLAEAPYHKTIAGTFNPRPSAGDGRSESPLKIIRPLPEGVQRTTVDMGLDPLLDRLRATDIPNDQHSPVYSSNLVDQQAFDTKLALDELKMHLDQVGIDYNQLSNEQVRRELYQLQGGELWQDPSASIIPEGVPVTPEMLAEAKRQYEAVVVLRDDQGRLITEDGKLSKLTEHQYRQVRTAMFKDWFGDWQTLSAEKAFDEMGPYKLSIPETLQGLSVKDLRKAVESHLIDLARSGEVANHPYLGAIDFGTNASGKMINKSHDPAKLYVGSDIVNVLEGSRLVNSAPSVKQNKQNELAYHTLINKIDVFGREFAVILTVK